MTLPPPQPPQQDSIAPSKDAAPGWRPLSSTQAQASASSAAVAAASAQPGARRLVLTPIATTVGSATWGSASRTSSQSSPRPPPTASTTTASPFASSFPSILNSSTREVSNSRQTSSPSIGTSPFPPLQAGSSQTPGSQPASSSAGFRTITPSSQHRQPSAAAPPTTVNYGGGGGGSGGGGPSSARGTSFTHSPSYSQTNVTLSPNSPPPNLNPAASSLSSVGSNNQAGQLSKIVVAQVFLLLSTIKEDKDKTRWESQADQIRKVDFRPIS